jgi:hypothetical protein
MLITEIYNGQGLGNQLACYVTTRVLAKNKGYDFGIMNPHKFKCLDFMNLDFGKKVFGGEGPEGGPPTKLPEGILYYYKEKWQYYPDGSNITIDDPNLHILPDNTKIDGILQSENMIYTCRDEIKEWLAVKLEKDNFKYSDDSTCVINFRGGEYKAVTAFFLRKQYWEDAIKYMKQLKPHMRFIVVSDDPEAAREFFPDYEVYHGEISDDYTIIKNAKYLILSNSSFPYFATLTSPHKQIIVAPKYWARHNTSDGYWSCGYNIFRNHNYIDREGKIFTYDECVKEFNDYKQRTNLYEYA